MHGKLLALILLCPAAALAGTLCATDTLADYEALGAGGCTIKGLPFSGFTFATVFASGGATPVTAAQITATPVDPDIAAGLDFSSAGFSVSSGQAVEYQLSWAVDDPPIIHGWDLELFDPVTFPAFITITSEECLGAAFIGAVCPTSLTATNTVSDNGIVAVLEDVKLFAPVRIVGELTTITLDAAAGGSASFTSFRESALLTPEPSGAIVTMSGVVLLFLARRTRLKPLRHAG
jgi:hypothetical protein